MCTKCESQSNHCVPSSFPPGHRQTFAALWSFCLQLTARRSPPPLLRWSGNLPANWNWPLGRPSHTWLHAMEADLDQQNIGLASAWRKQLFVKTGSALWTQQCSSGVWEQDTFVVFCCLQSGWRQRPQSGNGIGSGNILQAHWLYRLQEQPCSWSMSVFQCQGPQDFQVLKRHQKGTKGLLYVVW